MSRGIVRAGAALVGLLLLLVSLVYLSAAPALAGSSTVGSAGGPAVASAGSGQSQGPARPRTATPTRTPTRTPTPAPTLPPFNTATPTRSPTPIPNCGLTWRSVASPRPATALYGMAVVAANDIWAVGIDYTTNPARMLIEHWNGTAWSIVPSPSVGSDVSYLFQVSAVAANDIWAIGTRNNRTLALHWDGTAWSIAATPNPGINENYLLDVAAVAANDVWAVGYFKNGPPYAFLPFIVHWNGTAWSQVPPPNTGIFSNVLTSVTAIGANDIWAVGYAMAQNAPASQTQTLTIHWDGSSWSVVPSGFFNQLSAVSAVSSTDVWAVGSNGLYAITIHWNGSRWSEVPGPDPANNEIHLNGVVALAANDAWAVGYYDSLTVGGTVPLITHWDGTAWTEVPPGVGTPPNFLYAVAAASPRDVWAVGYNYSGPLILRYSDPCTLADAVKP